MIQHERGDKLEKKETYTCPFFSILDTFNWNLETSKVFPFLWCLKHTKEKFLCNYIIRFKLVSDTSKYNI